MPQPRVGIICGSGFSGLSSAFDNDDTTNNDNNTSSSSSSSKTKTTKTKTKTTLTIPYKDIPGFPAHCTVAGHKGEVVFGTLAGVATMCFRGRFHSYEGHDMKTVVLPVYVMRCLKVAVCIVTNAAGGLNPNYNVGDVVCISDHLALPQLAGNNPLIGKNDDELGPRFPATVSMNICSACCMIDGFDTDVTMLFFSSSFLVFSPSFLVERCLRQ